MLRRCVAFLSLLLLIPAVAPAADPPRQPLRSDRLGVNTAIGGTPSNASHAATDALKFATPWMRGWGRENTKIACDGGLDFVGGGPDDVLSAAGMFHDNPNYPLGRYTLTWDGDGDWRWNSNQKVIESGPGRIVFEEMSRSGVGLYIQCTRSNPANRVRNLHLWMPRYENATSYWTDEYVAGLKGYSVLRVVQEMACINSRASRTTDRTKLTDLRWTYDYTQNDWAGPWGIPLEALCDLANRAEADLWLCVPILADDDLVRWQAVTAKAMLEPGRKIWVELDCENWNWVFLGSRLNLDHYSPGSTDNFNGQTDWFPYRFRQVASIWEDVFKDQRDRLVTVLAGQAGWFDRNQFLLTRASKFNAGGKPCDAFAIAPYFGPSEKLAKELKLLNPGNTTVEDLFVDLNAQIDMVAGWVTANRKIVDGFPGVKFVAYEAGPDLQGNDDATKARYAEVANDPQMYPLMRRYLDMLYDRGLEHVNLYNEQGPVWGQIERPGIPLEAAHKRRAGVDFIHEAHTPITPDILRLPPPPIPAPDPVPPAEVPASALPKAA